MHRKDGPQQQRVLLIGPEPVVHRGFCDAAASVDAMRLPFAGGKDLEPAGSLLVEAIAWNDRPLERITEARKMRRPYAVVAVDLDSSGSPGGFEVVRRIYALSPAVPVLALTGGDAGRNEPLAAGSATPGPMLLLRKPLDPVEVRHALELLLGSARLHGELLSANRALGDTTRALEAARRIAERAERAKAEFMANMSHEIRTPMNAILGFSRLLMKGPLTEDQLEKLRYVHEAGNSLLEILDNTLDFSQLSAGKLTLQQAAFHLDDVIRDVLEATRGNARQKGLGLNCHTEEAVPRWLIGDPHRLRKILVNLVNNAIKFTEHGTIHLQTSLDEQSGNTASLRIVITDSGVGIPPERQAVIFESFAQADGSTTRQFGGIGLGLTICKLLVDMMGGQIGFRSEVGEGSSFWVTFTLPKAPRTAGGPQVSAPGRCLLNASWEAAQGGPKKTQVLVAENDRLTRSMIELLMTRAGCIVVLVGSGREALATLDDAPFDLALIGSGIPDTAGLEVIRAIRRREAATAGHLNTIALTSPGEGPDRRVCIEAGADDCLVKPITPEALFEAVQRLVPGFLGAGGPTGGDPDDPTEDADAWEALAGTVRAASDALEREDFHALESLAGELRTLASRVDARAISDHAMRLRLAARGQNGRRAAEAIAKIHAALDGLGADSKQTDAPLPLSM